MNTENPSLPPCDNAAERTLLGLALQSDQALMRTIEIIRGDYFYETRHNLIWNAMLNLNRAATGVDIVTVADALDRMQLLSKAGGRTYLWSSSQMYRWSPEWIRNGTRRLSASAGAFGI